MPAAAAIFRLLTCVALSCGAASAGEWNPTRTIGDVVPAWNDLRGTDGRDHSWSDFSRCAAVVVVFTSNACPYAIDHEARIGDLAARWAADGGRVALVAINSNQIPEDSLEAMTRRSEERGWGFPYLADPTQEVAGAFGALRTPEFFVLDARRRIRYMGALDDDPEGGKPTRRHVEEAVAAVLGDREPEIPETAPVGCLIRSKRRRGGEQAVDR